MWLSGTGILLPDRATSMFLEVARPHAGLFWAIWLAVNGRLLLASFSLPTTRAWGVALEKLLLVGLEICSAHCRGRSAWLWWRCPPSASRCGAGWSRGCTPHSSPGATLALSWRPPCHSLSTEPNTLSSLSCFASCQESLQPHTAPRRPWCPPLGRAGEATLVILKTPTGLLQSPWAPLYWGAHTLMIMRSGSPFPSQWQLSPSLGITKPHPENSEGGWGLLCPMSESPNGKREGLQGNATDKKGTFITDSSQGPLPHPVQWCRSESPWAQAVTQIYRVSARRWFKRIGYNFAKQFH